MNGERTYIVKCIHCSTYLDAVITFNPDGHRVTVMVYWDHHCNQAEKPEEANAAMADDRD